MNWISSNWLKIIVSIALLISSISIFYYFVLFLPEEHKLKLEIEREEKTSKQRLNEETQERENRRIEEQQKTKQLNSQLLNTCLYDASTNYMYRWNQSCKKGFGRGHDTRDKCSLPEWMSDQYMRDYNAEKEDCFKQYPLQ